MTTSKQTSGLPAPKLGARLDRHWHLATDEHEVALTELEFAILRASSSFERWMSDCLACCHAQPFSGSDNAVLHVIRMHERPKGISEIGRLLKRDDQSNLQYTVRKLLKAGLIEKAQAGSSKKDVTYQVTELGRQVTDQFARFRQELLISLTRSIEGLRDLDGVSKLLNLMSGLYDQASCVAVTHRVPAE